MPSEQVAPAPLPEQIYVAFFRQMELETANDSTLVDALRRCLANGTIGDRKRIQAEVAVALAVTAK